MNNWYTGISEIALPLSRSNKQSLKFMLKLAKSAFVVALLYSSQTGPNEEVSTMLKLAVAKTLKYNETFSTTSHVHVWRSKETAVKNSSEMCQNYC